MPRQRSRRKSSRGLSQQQMVWLILGLALLAVFIYVEVSGWEDTDDAAPPTAAPPTAAPPAAPPGGNIHLALGNPSGAVSDSAQPGNYLISRDQYALSYHRDRGIPNWASWRLAAEDLGDVERYAGQFIPDGSLPTGWYQVRHSDYSGSGYDRGHMVPSADRTATVDDNTATFLLTNILPQAPDNNQGPWADLENHIRDLVRRGNVAYIVAGPQGEAGRIAGGALAVPAAVWKVAVVVPAGSDELARVGAEGSVIAVLMPNDESVAGQQWDSFSTTVGCIEELTGLDLLSALADQVEAELAGAGCPAGGQSAAPIAAPTGSVSIAAVEYDPPGDDLAGEYVRLRNNGSTPVSLDGWALQDEAAATYIFPAVSLAPGAELWVWVRLGSDDGANLFWGRTQPVWNNGGDTVILSDQTGNEVARYRYP